MSIWNQQVILPIVPSKRIRSDWHSRSSPYSSDWRQSIQFNYSERPYPDFSSTSYGRTMWGQSSAEPCRTVPNKVRQQCTVTTYGNKVRQQCTVTTYGNKVRQQRTAKTNGQLPPSISRERVVWFTWNFNSFGTTSMFKICEILI